MVAPQRPNRDELAATLALAQVPGIGAARLRALVAAFGSGSRAIAAPARAIAALPGLGPAAAAAIRAASPAVGEAILATLDRLGAGVLLSADTTFPPLLREIHEPPAVLFVWGDVSLLSRPAVAIVGSRNHTPYGAAATRLLATGVARQTVVVSGMARGLDAIAHTAALDAGGGSVGVLGNGFGVVYPAANQALYDRMVREGCLVTEHAPGERPRVSTFPRRNRIIAGLCGATVVVEAAAGSGALISADFALDQGRAVLAVPGPITSPTSVGCNKLIQQGAKPALSVADVLEEFGLSVTPVSPATVKRTLPEDLSSVQRMLCDALVGDAKHVDALVAAAQREAGGVLTGLELRGVVRQEAGMRVTLI